MSGKKILVCKDCGAMCDYDEINSQNVCFDCYDLFCELGEESENEE